MIRHHWSQLSLSVSFSVTQKTKSGTDRLVFEIYKSHTHTHTAGLLWKGNELVAESLSRFRIRDLRNWEAANLRFRLHGQHDWHKSLLVLLYFGVNMLCIFPSVWSSTGETLLPTIILAFISFQPDFCLLTRRLDIQTFIHIHISAHLF